MDANTRPAVGADLDLHAVGVQRRGHARRDLRELAADLLLLEQ
jgi:hypothetical protein